MMTKKVNIYPTRPIVTVNPPIRSAVKNVTKPLPDIRACIMARAIVEEIMEDGRVTNLDLNNYDKDNTGSIPTVKINVDLTDATKEDVAVYSQPSISTDTYVEHTAEIDIVENAEEQPEEERESTYIPEVETVSDTVEESTETEDIAVEQESQKKPQQYQKNGKNKRR